MEHRVLWVDLSTGETWEEVRGLEHLGGRGLGVEILTEHLPAGADPLEERSIITFCTGVLTGTPAPASGRACAVAKSPLTLTVFDSHCGGSFGYHLRRTGYSALAITGVAEEWCWLHVTGEGCRVISAEELRGRSTSETVRALESKLGRCAVACIGRAGENLVRFASIMHGSRAFGRGGLGAVLGSKRVKALAVQGTLGIPLAEPAAFRAEALKCHRKLLSNPACMTLKRYGTPNVLEKVNFLGVLPTRNFSAGVFEHAGSFGAEEVIGHLRAEEGCFSCPLRCGKRIRVGKAEAGSLEYESLFALGANLGIGELEHVVRLARVCDELGMDTISAGGTLAAYFEALEQRGRPCWGDFRLALRLLGQIAEREGEGMALAEGSARALPEHSISVKRLELPGYDPRGGVGVALAYATSPRGGCHLRAPVYVDEYLAQTVDRRTTQGKAELVKHRQDLHAAIDSLVMCRFTARALAPENYAKLFTLASGEHLSPEELLRRGERIFCMEVRFNRREGVGEEEDTLPERLLTHEIPSGPSAGMRATLEPLEEYRSLRRC